MRDLRQHRGRSDGETVCNVAVAMIGSAVIGAAISGGAAKSAAKTQANSAAAASAVQQKMYDQTRSDLEPYRNAGAGAIPALNNLLTGNPNQVRGQLDALPGYQFARTQGLKAVQNSATSRGLGISGAAQKGAANFATGLADETFGNQVGRLQGFANMGENAAAQTGTFGVQTGQNIGNNLIGAGNATAAGQVGAANAISGAISGIPNAFLLNRLLGPGGGAAQGGMYGSGSTGSVPYWGSPLGG